MMAWLRSIVHFVWMGVTMPPFALIIIVLALAGVRGDPLDQLGRALVERVVEVAPNGRAAIEVVPGAIERVV